MSIIKKIERKYLYFLMLVPLFLVFAATRLWRNNIIPYGLHVDEAAMAYDAWSLANYGVDRHLKSWPVYLINYGSGQNVLYCYLLAGLFKLFGFSYGLIRVPAVIFSLLTLVFGMLLAAKLFRDWPILSLAAGGLVVICPYFIMASRLGLESSLMVGMATVFLYCFVCAMDNGKYRWYIVSGITGGLVLYTYAIAYLALPAFLLFALIYAVRVRRFAMPKWVSMAIPMGFLAFPLILEQYINAFDLEEIHLGIFTVTKLRGYRVSEIGFPTWHNFTDALRCIFIRDHLPYNSVSGYTNLYNVTIPLVIIGVVHALSRLIRSLKKREFNPLVYLFFWFLVMLLTMSCVSSGANANKVNGIFFSVIFLAVEGIYVFLKMGSQCKRVIFEIDGAHGHENLEFRNMQWCKAVVVICGILYAIGFIRFSSYYYLGGYSAEYPAQRFFDITVEEAVEFLEENPQYKHNRTYMAEDSVFFAVSSLISPYDLMLDENDYLLLDYYYCGALTVPEDGCNYIVRDIYPEYAQSLRDLGYTEIKYTFYSLFYQEEY